MFDFKPRPDREALAPGATVAELTSGDVRYKVAFAFADSSPMVMSLVEVEGEARPVRISFASSRCSLN